MGSPYSYDLRTKAIEAVERGVKKAEVCRTFGISPNTLYLWLKRKKETGDYQAITDYQQGYGHKITDLDEFRAFIDAHSGKTQAQIAELWGDDVTQQNISDALQKIGFTRKKRPMAIENATKNNAKNLLSD